MDESRRLAMRRAHACRSYYCTCGQVVVGNGGRASHKNMHWRKDEDHHFMTATERERRAREALSER